MPIRLRIALLALTAVIGAISALFIVYLDGRERIAGLEAQVGHVALIRQHSELIHKLQRERGSSGGFLANRSSDYLARVTKSREDTDAALGRLIAPDRPAPGLISQGRLADLERRLSEIRRSIDGGQVSWQYTRDFYTSAISELLDAIATHVPVHDGTRFAIATYTAVELAAAREALGLIRATVYFIASQEKPNPRDFVDLAIYYGLFQQHAHEFLRGLPSADYAAINPYFQSREYLRVIATVEAALQPGYVASHVDSEKWWSNSTAVIDHFKAVEDSTYQKQINLASADIDSKKRNLNIFAVTAVMAGLLVSLFAMLTIARILRALNELQRTLGNIIEEENFTLRLHPGGKSDEFSHIGHSLNQLLEFTDSLIRDKERLASTDELTGIMNRRSFMKSTAREMSRADRYGTECAYLFIDIDHFKRVNDEHGHAVGDEVLKGFAEVLRRNLRTSDLLARWGGEEFVVLAPETRPEAALQFAEKLRERVAAEQFPGVGPVTCSVGLANTRPGESFDALARRADDALYEAKETGRNRVCVA